MILFEYGEDYIESKILCQKLEIEEHVLWIKKIDRKSILLILDHVDVGVGEFYKIKNLIWGGAAVEILSSGIPLIHGGYFKKDNFKKFYKIPVPPILFANSKNEIYDHMLYLFENNEYRTRIGDKSLNWINNYYGKKGILKWKFLLQK